MEKSARAAGEMPDPELREDDVLVQVHAAGVNLLDSKIRDGEFKLILPYRLPLILGNDVAGVVVRVGPRVRQFKLGDEVYARPDDFRIGTFAEFIPVKEASARAQAQGTHDGRSRFHPAGGLDGMAGAGREGQPEEGAEGLHSGGLRRPPAARFAQEFCQPRVASQRAKEAPASSQDSSVAGCQRHAPPLDKS